MQKYINKQTRCSCMTSYVHIHIYSHTFAAHSYISVKKGGIKCKLAMSESHSKIRKQAGFCHCQGIFNTYSLFLCTQSFGTTALYLQRLNNAVVSVTLTLSGLFRFICARNSMSGDGAIQRLIRTRPSSAIPIKRMGKCECVQQMNVSIYMYV